MPWNEEKRKCIDTVRHAEYYGLLRTFDDLYERSHNGEVFDDLMGLILSEDNICLAYRNIKTNTGSNTPGTDGLTIEDIGSMPKREVVEFVRYIVRGSAHGYRPKPVRRKDIPKPYDPTKTRPLGIPCIWDRIVQQCIKQVMEPICEAKFSENSYGFRPARSAQNAIHRCELLLQSVKLHYVVEFDIKGFFDNVNHPKLIKQIWALGIRDKELIWIIKRILKAQIKMPDGSMITPDKGTPQGGIISPLLANIVLNELDHWVESQWQAHPVREKYSTRINSTGSVDYGNGYKAMKKTNLKEMYIVRYADDFRIFCRTRQDAERTKIAVTKWIEERLRLEVSPTKTRIVNTRKRYSDFLGIKMRVHMKAHKYVIESHMSDKAIAKVKENLIQQIHFMGHPRHNRERDEIERYNSIVMGVHNYYQMATHISEDCRIFQNITRLRIQNRMNGERGSRISREGRPLTKSEEQKYGNSKQIRYAKASGEPIYPIGYIQHKFPVPIRYGRTIYSAKGREIIHDELEINTVLMGKLRESCNPNMSIEACDNIISRFSAQWGKCAVTGRTFRTVDDIYCHHRRRLKRAKMDKYSNLTLVLPKVHQLIVAVGPAEIQVLKCELKLTPKMLIKLNELRELLKLEAI